MLQLKIAWDQQIKVPESTQHYKDKQKNKCYIIIPHPAGDQKDD